MMRGHFLPTSDRRNEMLDVEGGDTKAPMANRRRSLMQRWRTGKRARRLVILRCARQYGAGRHVTGAPRAPALLGVKGCYRRRNFERITGSKTCWHGVIPSKFTNSDTRKNLSPWAKKPYQSRSRHHQYHAKKCLCTSPWQTVRSKRIMIKCRIRYVVETNTSNTVLTAAQPPRNRPDHRAHEAAVVAT